MITIDGLNLKANRTDWKQEESGGITRSVHGQLFDNRIVSLANHQIRTPLMDPDVAENLLKYYLGNGEIYTFAKDDVEWYCSNKGNAIESVDGNAAQDDTTSVGFGENVRCLKVDAGGKVVLGTVLPDEWTVIAQVSIVSASGGTWNTAVRSSSSGLNAFLGNSYGALRGTTNRITIENNRVCLNGRSTDTAPGTAANVWFSDVVIMKHDLTLATHTKNTLGAAVNQVGGVSYMGRYPTLDITMGRNFKGRFDSSSLTLNYDYGTSDNRDKVFAELSGTILEDKNGF